MNIHLDTVRSTNSWLLDSLADGNDWEDMSVVWTMRQTAGRGQVGNSWEAEEDKNISFSVLLKPTFLHPREQFSISEITALAVRHAVDDELNISEAIAGTSDTGETRGNACISVKWPNDVYAGDEKVAGILIENRLQGCVMSHCVLGIGINVNQMKWVGNAPNPTSLRLLSGHEHNPQHVMERVVEYIGRYYDALRNNPDEAKAAIHDEFCRNVYRRNGFFPYKDAQSGETFEAEISGIEPTGPMHLKLQGGEERTYSFKEVRYVLAWGDRE